MIQEESEFTHFYDDPKNKTLVLYKLKDKTPIRIEVPYETEYQFAVAQLKNQLYFTGGGTPAHEDKGELYLKTAKRVSVNPKDMDTIPVSLANMNIARSRHTMAIVSGNAVYVVGGYNSNGIISSCEEYYITKGTWRICASLNEKKMQVSLIVIEPKYIYAFGGEKSEELSASKMIECLDTSKKEEKLWTQVILNSGADIWPETCFSGTFQVSTDIIMIFGGCFGKSEANGTFMFNIKSKSMTKGENLATKDLFYMTRPVVCGNDLVVIGKNEGHVYNLLDQKWSLIKKETFTPVAGFFIKADTY